MRPSVILSLLSAALMVGCAGTQSGTSPLSQLDGWQVDGEASWEQRAEEIVGYGDGDGFLVSRDSFGDFELALEFRVDADTNSGIFLRCQSRQRIHPETC